MATLNPHAALARRAPSATATTASRRDRPARAPPAPPPGAPRSRVAYALGVATVCALALATCWPAAGRGRPPEHAGRSPSPTRSASTARTDAPAMEDPELLEQLAASRARARRGPGRGGRLAGAGRAGRRGRAGRGGGAGGRRGGRRSAAAAEAAAAAGRRGRRGRRRPPRPAAAAAARRGDGRHRHREDQQQRRRRAAAGPGRRRTRSSPTCRAPAGITIGGTRASAADPGGHPSGLALDYMVLPTPPSATRSSRTTSRTGTSSAWSTSSGSSGCCARRAAPGTAMEDRGQPDRQPHGPRRT